MSEDHLEYKAIMLGFGGKKKKAARPAAIVGKSVDDGKKQKELRDMDPGQILQRYEKMLGAGEDIPAHLLMYVGDIHRDLKRTDEALRLYGAAARKTIEDEQWRLASQILQKANKLTDKPTVALLQLSLRIALGEGQSAEATRIIHQLESYLTPRQGAEIDAIVGIVEREAAIDTSVEFALLQMLTAMARGDRALERLKILATRARRAGKEAQANAFEKKLKEAGVEEERASGEEYFGNFSPVHTKPGYTPEPTSLDDGLWNRPELMPELPDHLDDKPEPPRAAEPVARKPRSATPPASISIETEYDDDDDFSPAPVPQKPARTTAARRPDVVISGSLFDDPPPEPSRPSKPTSTRPDEDEDGMPSLFLNLPPLVFPDEKAEPADDEAAEEDTEWPEEQEQSPVAVAPVWPEEVRPETPAVRTVPAEVAPDDDDDPLAGFFALPGEEDAFATEPEEDAPERTPEPGPMHAPQPAALQDIAPELDEEEIAEPEPAGTEVLWDVPAELPEPPAGSDMVHAALGVDMPYLDLPLPSVSDLMLDIEMAKEEEEDTEEEMEIERNITEIVDDDLIDLSGDEKEQIRTLARALITGIKNNMPEEDAETHYQLGQAFLQMGLFHEASEAYQLAWNSKGYRIRALEGLAQSFVERGSPGLSYRVVKMVLPEIEEGSARTGALYWLGRSAEALKKLDEAKEAYASVSLMDVSFMDAASRLDALEAQ